MNWKKLAPLMTSLALFGADAAAPPSTAPIYEPWFTGPLLAPTPINVPPGLPALEPGVTVYATYGSYRNNWKLDTRPCVWSINPFFDFQFALSERLGIEVLAGYITNMSQGKSFSAFQDTLVFLGYQVCNDVKGTWIPNFRILLQETFPSGHYQRFDPDRLPLQSTGQGSYQTGLVAAFEKLLTFGNQFFALHWSLSYLFYPTKVDVSGFNTFGGGYDTRGTVKPGQTMIAFFSGEYSLNQKWVLAFDTELYFQRSSHFSGHRGTTKTGAPASVGIPTSLQISFAPEIEYNLSSQAGFLTGLWFTLAGKNTPAFASAFLAFAYEF